MDNKEAVITLQKTGIMQYFNALLSGWRCWVLGIVWGSPITLGGLYSAIQSQSGEYNLSPIADIIPQEWWLTIILAWLSFSLFVTLLIISLSAFKKHRSYEENDLGIEAIIGQQNQLRKERKEYRKEFADRKQIVQKMYKLQKYLGKSIGKQKISGKVFLSVLIKWSVWYEIPHVVFMRAIWQLHSINKQWFNGILYNYSVNRVVRLNSILYKYNLGVDVIVEGTEYQTICDEIRYLTVGLPPDMAQGINKAIFISTMFYGVRLLDLRRTLWRSVPYPRGFGFVIPIVRPALRRMSMKIDDIMTEVCSNVSKDMENFLLGVK